MTATCPTCGQSVAVHDEPAKERPFEITAGVSTNAGHQCTGGLDCPTSRPDVESACGHSTGSGKCVMASGHEGPHGQVGLR